MNSNIADVLLQQVWLLQGKLMIIKCHRRKVRKIRYIILFDSSNIIATASSY